MYNICKLLTCLNLSVSESGPRTTIKYVYTIYSIWYFDITISNTIVWDTYLSLQCRSCTYLVFSDLVGIGIIRKARVGGKKSDVHNYQESRLSLNRDIIHSVPTPQWRNYGDLILCGL